MKAAYLADQRRRGDGNDPFLEADRRETARQEAAAKRVHPTLNLPANSQPSTQVAGLLPSSGTQGASSTAQQTSAATTFFDPVSIGDRSFADAALSANNPVDEVEGEASNIWCLETGDLKRLVKCFVSVGTGNPGKKPFENSMIKFLGETVVQIATETTNTEKKFIARWAKHFDEKRYFRFDVDQGLQDIGLDEYKNKGTIEGATEGYLIHTAQKFRVRDCIQNLRLKQSVYLEDFS